jgi:hypothetical protein
MIAMPGEGKLARPAIGGIIAHDLGGQKALSDFLY